MNFNFKKQKSNTIDFDVRYYEVFLRYYLNFNDYIILDINFYNLST